MRLAWLKVREYPDLYGDGNISLLVGKSLHRFVKTSLKLSLKKSTVKENGFHSFHVVDYESKHSNPWKRNDLKVK